MAKRTKKTQTEAAAIVADVEAHALPTEPFSMPAPEADPDYNPETDPLLQPDADEPTPEEIAAVLETIDTTMEHAASAGVVDHETQISSWTPPAEAEEIREELELEAIVDAELNPEPFVVSTEVTGEQTLETVLKTVDEPLVEAEVFRIARAIDQRAAFEADKNAENDNIHKTLKKIRSQLVTKRAARLFLACNVDPAFINRMKNSGSEYNVYAIGKLADVVYGVTDGVVSNAINLACMKSLFAFKRAGLSFSMEAAKGAASKNYAARLDAAVRKHLISHTVAPGTAPTQASSTMQALGTLGIVRATGGKNPTYEILDTPLARKLEEMFAKAA